MNLSRNAKIHQWGGNYARNSPLETFYKSKVFAAINKALPELGEWGEVSKATDYAGVDSISTKGFTLGFRIRDFVQVDRVGQGIRVTQPFMREIAYRETEKRRIEAKQLDYYAYGVNWRGKLTSFYFLDMHKVSDSINERGGFEKACCAKKTSNEEDGGTTCFYSFNVDCFPDALIIDQSKVKDVEASIAARVTEETKNILTADRLKWQQYKSKVGLFS